MSMSEMMGMDDNARIGTVLLDQLEWRHSDSGAAAVWEAEGWYGNDYNKLWLKSEGERVSGATHDARADLLWDRIISRWWDLQLGVRQDFGSGPARTWGAVGLQGKAAYGVDIEATLYVSDAGHTAARLKAEYDLLLTQRLILQPQGEAELYSKSEPRRDIDSGLSHLELGIRLRYEIRRELAPYIGVIWVRRQGAPADTTDTQLIAGIRAWL
jgi:copper resistance protein B